MIDIPFIIYIVLAVPLVLLGDVLRMNWGFRPDLAIIFVVALAFSGRGRLAPLFGLFLGLILDNLNYESRLTYALGLFLVGLLVTYVRSRYLRRNIIIRCLVFLCIYEGFRLYLIAMGSLHYRVLTYPSFHPGILAPGLFISLLIFLPLTMLLDRLMPDTRGEETMGEVFMRG